MVHISGSSFDSCGSLLFAGAGSPRAWAGVAAGEGGGSRLARLTSTSERAFAQSAPDRRGSRTRLRAAPRRM
ncbi:unnamed protein product, partial [Iphiclides podalirius]